jgi:hypothetical protein
LAIKYPFYQQSGTFCRTVEDVPLCPALPKRVSIGEISDEDEHLETLNEAETVNEIAA